MSSVSSCPISRLTTVNPFKEMSDGEIIEAVLLKSQLQSLYTKEGV